VRVGFDFKGRAGYFNIPLQSSVCEPMTEIYARCLAPLGITFQRQPLPNFVPCDPVRESSGNRIIIHPGAHHSTQRWPAESFAELVRRIHGGGETCLVIGGDAERDLVAEIVRRSDVAAAQAIPQDVMQLAATIRSAEVVIGNNSGPLHLAALLGMPTVSSMGPTIKARWTPAGNHHVVLRRDELPCIGCNLGYCRIRTHACMKQITPDDAYAAYFRLRAQLLLESMT
jgi:ADP-heptose:LPS heptosyltransferase